MAVLVEHLKRGYVPVPGLLQGLAVGGDQERSGDLPPPPAAEDLVAGCLVALALSEPDEEAGAERH